MVSRPSAAFRSATPRAMPIQFDGNVKMLHPISCTQQDRQREPSDKTLSSPPVVLF